MKPSIKIYCLICICLYTPFIGKAQSNTGDSLFALGVYEQSALEYERAIFNLQPNQSTERNRLLLNKANAYFEHGNYQEALKNITRADFFTGNDSLRFQLYFKAALYTYLLQHLPNSRGYLTELYYYIEDESLKKQALFLDILLHLAADEWSHAQDKFHLYTQLYNLNDPQIEQILTNEHPRLKNVAKAESLSYFLPGIGQWYAGYPIQGFTSGGLQALLGVWGVYSIYNGYFFSGAFTGITLMYVFYTGGVRYAVYLANQTNEKRKEVYIQPFRSFLVNHQKTL